MSEATQKLKGRIARFLSAIYRGLKAVVLTAMRSIALFMRGLKRLLHKLYLKLRKFHRSNMRRFTKWIDPRLEKYRPTKRALQQPTSPSPDQDVAASETALEPTGRSGTLSSSARKSNIALTTDAHELCVPQSQSDFLKILQNTPRDVLDYRARQIITMAFQLPKTHASDLMIPKSKITYVHDDETLGPLTLDRLYKTGFCHFPVIDKKENVIGTVHTTSFNNLEIKETSTVREILDPGIYYIRADYTLEQVLAAFLRVNCYFFLVVDSFGRTVGMLTFARLISFLFGDTVNDRFQQDNNRLAVAKRREN